MTKYKCEICGKNHTIFRSMEIPFPKLILEMGEEEREERVNEFEGLLTVDNKLLFAHGWIIINVENQESPFFSWKTWTSISKEQLSKNFGELKSGKGIEFSGKLEAKLPFYQNSIDLNCNTLIQFTTEETIIKISVQEESELKNDQDKPITEKRIIEIMQMIHHNPKRESHSDLDESFQKRLSAELNEVVNKYFENENDFAINVESGSTLFQIVSNKILETATEPDFGFGLHLSFDESFEESKKELANFKKTKYPKEFLYHYLDEIPTYQIDVGRNNLLLIELVESIVKEVYKEDIEMIRFDTIEL